MAETIETKFSATLGGGTQQTFSAMQKGFRQIAKELQGTAKELLKLQKTEAADAIGHVSMAVNKFATNLGKLGQSTKKATTDLKQLENAEKHFANSSRAAQEAWDQQKKAIDQGTNSFKVAFQRANQVDLAMKNLVADVKQLGSSQKLLNKDVALHAIEEQRRAGNLQIVAGRFKFLNAEAYKTFTNNKNLIGSLRELHSTHSTYNKTLQAASKIKFNDAYVKAVKELGKQVGYVDDKFKVFVPILNRTEANLQKLKTAQKALTGEQAKWVAGVDRAALANQSLINAQSGVVRHVQQTTNGFKILSMQGLKPFNGLTLEMAQKLGMLDSHFQKFLNNMKLVKEVTGKSSAEIAKIGQEILKQSGSFEKASVASKKYFESLKMAEKSKAAIKELTVKYQDLFNATGKNAEQARKWIQILGQQPGKLNEVKAALAKLNSAHTKEVNALNRAKDAYNTLKIQYRDLLNAQDKYGASANRVIEALKRKGTSISQVRAKLNQLAKDHVNASRSMSSMEGIVNRLAKSIRTYGSYMISSTLLRGMTEGFRAATKSIVEHDQGLQDLKAIMQATTSEVMRMDTTIMQVAKDTKFSVGETAEAMKKLGQAGFTATEAIAGMPNIANLATGTLESLQSAVDLTSTAVRVFRLGMDETGKVADIFANAVTKSRLTVSKLNISFNYIGPLAKAAGLSLKQTSAAMMLLANSGLRASTIGTGFRRVLALLLKPTDAFKAAVENAGLKMDDFNPRITDFSKIIENLPKVVKNSEDAIKMFGLRGSSVITAFTTQGSAEFERLRGTLDQTGTASRMAATQMQGLGVMLKNIKDRFGVLAVEIGKAGITDILKGLVSGLRSALNALISFVQTGVGQFIVRMTAMATVLGTVAMAVTALKVLFVTKLVPAIYAFITAAKAAGVIPLVAVITAITAAVMLGINAWMSYKKGMMEVIKVESEYAGKMEDIESKMKMYNKIVEEKGRSSEEAKKAALSLKQSIEEVGDETNKSAKFVKEFGGAIDKNTGLIKNSDQVMSDLAKTVETEMVEAHTKAAKAANDLYTKQQNLHRILTTYTGWNALKTTMQYIGQLWDWLVEKVNAFTVTLDRVGVDWKGALTKVSYFIPIVGGIIRNELNKPIKSATDAFNEMKIAAADNDKAAKALDVMVEKAKDIAPTLLNGMEASELTSEKVEELAGEFARLNQLGPEMEGAIVNALVDMGLKAQETKVAVETAGSGIATTVAAINAEWSKLGKDEKATYDQKSVMIDLGIQKVQAATVEELRLKREASTQELIDFQGNAEQKTALMKKHQEEYAEIQKLGASEVNALEEARELAFRNANERRLENIEDYYEGEKELATLHHEDSKTAKDQYYADLKSKLDAALDDEDKAYIAANELEIQRHKSQIAEAETHYDLLSDIAQRDFKARIEAAKTLPAKEGELNTKVLELNKELLGKQKEVLTARKSAYQTTLDAMYGLEQELTGKIKSEIESRKTFNEGIENTLLELKRKTMTDEEVFRSKIDQAAKLAAEARAHQLKGESALAKEVAEKSVQAYKDAAGSVGHLKKGTTEYKSTIEDISSKIQEVQSTWNDASQSAQGSLEAQKAEVQSYIAELKKGIETTNQVLTDTITKLQTIGGMEIKLNTEQAIADLKSLQETIDEMSGKEVKIDFLGEGSEIKPISEKIDDIKGKIKELSESEDNKSEFTVGFMGDTGDGAKKLGETFRWLAMEIDNVQQYLKKLTEQKWTIEFAHDKIQEVIDKLQEISAKLTELANQDPVMLQVTIQVDNLGDLVAANNTWNQLLNSDHNITKTVTIHTKRTGEGNKEGGPITANQGQRIPGYGGGDKVDALLEPGEWVIRKEAVQKYGDEFMDRLNKMQFASGGRADMISPAQWKRKYVTDDPQGDYVKGGGKSSWKKAMSMALRKMRGEKEETGRAPAIDPSSRGLEDFLFDKAMGMRTGGSVQEKEREREKKSYSRVGSKITLPNVSTALAAWRDSQDPKDLYKAINDYANEIDFNLTNVGIAMQSGAAGVSLRSKSPVSRAPRNIYRGYYGAEGEEKPNKRELNFITHAAGVARLNRIIHGADFSIATDGLLEIQRMMRKMRMRLSTGGAVPAISQSMNSFDKPALRRSQGGAVPVLAAEGPSHTVHFQLGGQVHGPFTAKGDTATSLISSLNRHRMRS